MKIVCCWGVFVLFVAGWRGVGLADETAALKDGLLFHASFDEGVDADFARGDARMYTAPSLQRESARAGLHADKVIIERGAGRHGNALAFRAKTDELIFYRGGENTPYAPDGFQGAFSFWMRLSPGDDLPPGYVDPLQITDKKWNDASLFVDFTDKNPRHFRLGVFADYAVWNPDDIAWDDIPAARRPMVTVAEPPFARDKWTHVAVTFRNFNAAEETADAVLYLDGRPQGTVGGRQQFTWNRDQVVIMLGIAYVGHLDDLAIFDRALSAAEVRTLQMLPDGIKSLD